MAYKKSLGGNKGVLDKFPNIEEQIQISVSCYHSVVYISF